MDAMATFITSLGTVVTGVATQMTTVTTSLIGNELFLFCFGVGLFGAVVGLVKRAM